ncbi:MAG: LytR C-terminal domain-containing protein [Candidatus Yonathbacteria bacterium]|nr:LytR C-terminal domain-containing protein [Candidatus Yonathbacteria bacterium]
MSKFIKNISVVISEVKPRDLIYPGIFLLFVIIVGISFSLATEFISKNINNAFSGDTASDAGSLNMTNYTLVAKKLGISAEMQKKTVALPPTPPAPSEAPISPVPEIIDKKTFTINILNSTTKKGGASTLAQALESAGFAKATTGNEKKLYATTTIVIKEGEDSFGAVLLEEVRKNYPDAVATTTPDSASFDATIIIGSK